MQATLFQILKPEPPKSIADRGRLLYSSKVIHPFSRKKLTAEIYSKMIIIGEEHIPFSFEIRFFVKDNTIEFDCQ
jgi:hypothetical protein